MAMPAIAPLERPPPPPPPLSLEDGIEGGAGDVAEGALEVDVSVDSEGGASPGESWYEAFAAKRSCVSMV